MTWRWINGWQPEVKIHSIITQEKRRCSADWGLKSIFVHYNTFSKLLHIPKKNECVTVAFFKPQWSLKLFGFCLCVISFIALLVPHQQTCKSKSCYKIIAWEFLRTKPDSVCPQELVQWAPYPWPRHFTSYHNVNPAASKKYITFIKSFSLQTETVVEQSIKQIHRAHKHL